jgi:Fe-S-cluster containining protein
MAEHPCQTCGACCTKFSVRFYWREIEDPILRVPARLTEECGTFHNIMKGTTGNRGLRCVALEGNLGKRVGCSIYGNRPTPCREFEASFESGIKRDRCDHARIEIGLKPLRSEDWVAYKNPNTNFKKENIPNTNNTTVTAG